MIYGPMKICFLIKAIDNVGGTERVTLVLAGELSRRGYDVDIVSLVGDGKPFFPVAQGIKLHYLHHGPDRSIFPYRDIRRIAGLKKLFAQINPDFLIVVDASRALMRMPACKPYRTIYWEHFNTFIPRESRLMQRISRRLAVKYGAAVVTLTEADAENYARLYGAGNALCIPNPVSFEIPEYEYHAAHKVVAVGRFAYQKGFDLLLKTWAQVRDKGDWTLQLAGRGKQRQLLENMIKDLQLADSVQLLPPTDDITALFAQAGIYAMTSRFEGLPLVLIEAQACGLPAVSFDCKTGPSEIIRDGKSGFLAADGDVGQFARKLQELMRNEQQRKSYSKAAYEHAREAFSLKNIGDRWEALFRSLT